MESKAKGSYQFTNPQFVVNHDTHPFPNHWFVSFQKKKYISAPSEYLVVIDNRDGEIVYSQKKYPSTVQDLRWVFGVERKDYRWHNNEPGELTKK